MTKRKRRQFKRGRTTIRRVYMRTHPQSRAAGKSYAAIVSYRFKKKLKDSRSGKTYYNQSKISEVLRSGMVGKIAAETKLEDVIEDLEDSERRRDSNLGRDIVLELPIELQGVKGSLEDVTWAFARFLSERYKTVAFVAIHNKDGNPHAHVFLPNREYDYGVRRQTRLNKLLDRKASPNEVKLWRQEFAEILNRELERRGLSETLEYDHRSYKDSGLRFLSEFHEGRGAEAASRSELNKTIREHNERVLDLMEFEEEIKKAKPSKTEKQISPQEGASMINEPSISTDKIATSTSPSTNTFRSGTQLSSTRVDPVKKTLVNPIYITGAAVKETFPIEDGFDPLYQLQESGHTDSPSSHPRQTSIEDSKNAFPAIGKLKNDLREAKLFVTLFPGSLAAKDRISEVEQSFLEFEKSTSTRFEKKSYSKPPNSDPDLPDEIISEASPHVFELLSRKVRVLVGQAKDLEGGDHFGKAKITNAITEAQSLVSQVEQIAMLATSLEATKISSLKLSAAGALVDPPRTGPSSDKNEVSKGFQKAEKLIESSLTDLSHGFSTFTLFGDNKISREAAFDSIQKVQNTVDRLRKEFADQVDVNAIKGVEKQSDPPETEITQLFAYNVASTLKTLSNELSKVENQLKSSNLTAGEGFASEAINLLIELQKRVSEFPIDKSCEKPKSPSGMEIIESDHKPPRQSQGYDLT
ncbi:MobA/MobL family protein [Pelagicoccus sp. SDUM812002]|uniref:MobA/MobL family protein n=1 Tax=Pelagicoccus sp. SDUM812002 TaxID=3041266 RepID=UPI00280E2E6F|nr:MobA/MobL family protein [Pelagicoccus sp. SDUM812002]MDQ8183967.1 MobA/MobL family protein [Pelagicoccus sp. SDUM812002]